MVRVNIPGNFNLLFVKKNLTNREDEYKENLHVCCSKVTTAKYNLIYSSMVYFNKTIVILKHSVVLSLIFFIWMTITYYSHYNMVQNTSSILFSIVYI